MKILRSEKQQLFIYFFALVLRFLAVGCPMNDIAMRRCQASTREEIDEQLVLMGSLLKTIHHFFGGFSPSVLWG